VQAKIERIGERFGLLLPKELLDACGFGNEVTVTLQNKTLVVSPGPRQVRAGWADAIRAIPQRELDRDFGDLQAFRETADEWESSDWQWPGAETDETA
jgi:antitoxin component of MazEF toxin-antitoxin module